MGLSVGQTHADNMLCARKIQLQHHGRYLTKPLQEFKSVSKRVEQVKAFGPF
jgi:hypothetical protein